MMGTTKNEILDRVESVLEILQKASGQNAVEVLLANRDAIIHLHHLATDLSVGAGDRDRQKARKARRAANLTGMETMLDFRA